MRNKNKLKKDPSTWTGQRVLGETDTLIRRSRRYTKRTRKPRQKKTNFGYRVSRRHSECRSRRPINWRRLEKTRYSIDIKNMFTRIYKSGNNLSVIWEKHIVEVELFLEKNIVLCVRIGGLGCWSIKPFK